MESPLICGRLALSPTHSFADTPLSVARTSKISSTSVVMPGSFSTRNIGRTSLKMLRTSSGIYCNQMPMIGPPAKLVFPKNCLDLMLTFIQEALRHSWLTGENATDHNFAPAIRARMAKARLRKGVEAIKLQNRIEALKMQEDDDGEEDDIPADAKAAAGEALASPPGSAGPPSPQMGKRSLSKIAKGAIFREVVLAKVRAMKEEEKLAQAASSST